MKRLIIMTIVFVGCLQTAFAQNTIESIRKAYQGQKEEIARMSENFPGEGTPPVYYHLHVSQNLPGTGMHHENVRMYYGELPSEEEGDPFPPHYLSFVSAKYNFAAREYYEEYLYDDKGQLMFIYAYTPNEELTRMLEFRLYFAGQRLLRLDVKASGDSVSFSDPLLASSFKDVYTGTTIPEEYSEYCSIYTSWASNYLKMFEAIDNRTHL